MISETFNVNSLERVELVKDFVRTQMVSARFVCNPLKIGKEKWIFHITYEIEDMNKLSTLLNKFYEEDNPIEKSEEGWFTKFLKSFKL